MKIRNYFAAANGYTGFRSYFDRIFKSEDFERIFVLKGGPGTGKSTLMKRIAKKASLLGCDHDKIFCSSDPNSLDGVIVYSERGRFAILDGTAPHERDATIPGAIDTIINLGEGFNVSALSESRKEILGLNTLKKNAYKRAYDALRVAGAINLQITDTVAKAFSYDKANLLAERILNDTEASASVEESVGLRRAFCKLGEYSIDSYCACEQEIKIHGAHGEDLLFLNLLAKKAGQKKYIASFDPLDGRFCDALMPSKSLLVASSKSANASYSASELLECSFDEGAITLLEKARDTLLGQAEKYFKDAANHHLELERIYSSAMHFEKNEELTENILYNMFGLLS